MHQVLNDHNHEDAYIWMLSSTDFLRPYSPPNFVSEDLSNSLVTISQQMNMIVMEYFYHRDVTTLSTEQLKFVKTLNENLIEFADEFQAMYVKNFSAHTSMRQFEERLFQMKKIIEEKNEEIFNKI